MHGSHQLDKLHTPKLLQHVSLLPLIIKQNQTIYFFYRNLTLKNFFCGFNHRLVSLQNKPVTLFSNIISYSSKSYKSAVFDTVKLSTNIPISKW